MEFTTFGQRVKHARLAAKLSQLEFANAVANLTGSKTKKGLVSQWENNKVSNVQNATLLAIQAVTGFSAEWLVSGRGELRVKLPKLLVADKKAVYGHGVSREVLRRGIIIAATEQKTPDAIADAAIEVIESLADEPGLSDGILKRIARLAKTTA